MYSRPRSSLIDALFYVFATFAYLSTVEGRVIRNDIKRKYAGNERTIYYLLGKYDDEKNDGSGTAVTILVAVEMHCLTSRSSAQCPSETGVRNRHTTEGNRSRTVRFALRTGLVTDV